MSSEVKDTATVDEAAAKSSKNPKKPAEEMQPKSPFFRQYLRSCALLVLAGRAFYLHRR